MTDHLLPDGKKCRDCAFFALCEWLLSRQGDEAECDWEPSKFRDKPPTTEKRHGPTRGRG